MKNLAAALLKAQAELDPIKKGRKGHNYKYADLAAVLDEVVQELNKQGVVVLQPIMPASQANHARVDTILLHADSGEQLVSSTEVPWRSEARMNDAQSYGSAITYARRYALVSFICGATEDDDGATAHSRQTQPKPQPKNFAELDAVTDSFLEVYKGYATLDELKAGFSVDYKANTGDIRDAVQSAYNTRKAELEAQAKRGAAV